MSLLSKAPKGPPELAKTPTHASVLEDVQDVERQSPPFAMDMLAVVFSYLQYQIILRNLVHSTGSWAVAVEEGMPLGIFSIPV